LGAEEVLPPRKKDKDRGASSLSKSKCRSLKIMIRLLRYPFTGTQQAKILKSKICTKIEILVKNHVPKIEALVKKWNFEITI